MDVKEIKRLEYEEQFFRLSSDFLIDSFKRFLKDELEETTTHLVDNIRKKLLPQANNAEVFSDKLDQMHKQLQAEYQNGLEMSLAKNLPKIQSYLHIPDHVLLEEDLLVKTGLSINPAEVDDDIATTKQSLVHLLYMKQKILQEMEEADKAIELLQALHDIEPPTVKHRNCEYFPKYFTTD